MYLICTNISLKNVLKKKLRILQQKEMFGEEEFI
jgi:hypothetical protein